MKAKLFPRLLAYIIDISLLLVITFVFFENDMSAIKVNNTNYLNGVIDYNTFMDRNALLIFQHDKQNILIYLINVLYIILYFCVFPLYNEGATIGKKITGIKVEGAYNQSLTFKNLFLRNLIINGLFYLIVCILFLYLFSANVYFVLVTLAGFIQIVLVITSIFMILYRKDKRGLHDLLSKTKVVTRR